MKKLFFLVLYILPGMAGTSQAYHKLIRLNTYWDCYTWMQGWMCYSSVNRIFFTGADTIIEGKTYQISYAYPMYPDPPGPYLCPPFVIDTLAVDHEHYVREDTVEQKVYIHSDIFLEPDAILYDFTLQPGDTLTSGYQAFFGFPLVVTSVDSVMIGNGEYRKRINFDDPYYGINYVESIGGTEGLFTPLVPFESGGGFMCVKENGANLWGDECDYWFVNIPQYKINEVFIFPNPAHETITIAVPLILLNQNLKLFSSSGVLIKSIRINSEKTVLQLKGVNPGLYFYQISSGSTFFKGKLEIF